ncbi:phosphonate metabolism transcriptional regulator PhnF [Epibacterium sp. SM1979]|uniref:Phosphonate metabolism transcriptional regulator PhnF n=1 Tax=Tritonibacter litoralis TaxID=2662264 RepID=A0A843Y7I3_9RHOB|nr:phosphonate metabolism transcriptional regulator PhnF [Tritonibacter litoralis]MQQ06921.1 phosphonate metabolism transcriptional regulator PhnF [Tritonibacter litoralis]
MLKEKWRHVRDAIAHDISTGVLQPGDRLPTEPELVDKYGAGRHSVRRAVAELAREGSLSVEQGRGTFVESGPLLEYTIGKRTRLRRNLQGQGAEVQIARELLGAEIVPARRRVAEALNLVEGAPVVENRRMSLANGLPINFGTSYHDAERFPDFTSRSDVLGSVTDTYKTYGIDDYLRGETTLHSRIARPHEAKQLKQHPHTPVMVVRAIDTLVDGTPISFKQVIWSAVRVKFTIGIED